MIRRASSLPKAPTGTNLKSTAIQFTDQGQVSFDAAKLFDSIDTNGDGVLSYSELNVILQLDPLELNDFVRRMNALGSGTETDQHRVTKGCVCGVFSRRSRRNIPLSTHS